MHNKVKTLYESIKNKFQGNNYAAQTLKRLKDKPEDEGRQSTMKSVLKDVLAEDQQFQKILSQLLAEVKQAGGNTIVQVYDSGAAAAHGGVAASEGSQAAGGNIININSGSKNDSGKRAEGKLQISAIIPQYNKTNGTCLLDFRVHNTGGSDVLINYVNFNVSDVGKIFYLGHKEFSKIYDLDISLLKQKGDTIDYVVSQNIRPGKTDRFGIVLIARNIGIGVFRWWKLEPKLYTNFGEVLGEPVEFWLPHDPFPQSLKDELSKF